MTAPGHWFDSAPESWLRLPWSWRWRDTGWSAAEVEPYGLQAIASQERGREGSRGGGHDSTVEKTSGNGWKTARAKSLKPLVGRAGRYACTPGRRELAACTPGRRVHVLFFTQTRNGIMASSSGASVATRAAPPNPWKTKHAKKRMNKLYEQKQHERNVLGKGEYDDGETATLGDLPFFILVLSYILPGTCYCCCRALIIELCYLYYNRGQVWNSSTAVKSTIVLVWRAH